MQAASVIPVPEYSGLRPADILLRGWLAGKDTAVDLTICHAWQVSQQQTVSRERWRGFLRQKELEKHAKYDAACKAAEWETREERRKGPGQVTEATV